MCLILAAWRAVEGVPLVVAANRDEFHARPAAPAQFWEDIPAILAGRDLQAMGTWMGVARNGRFAAVTNYRGAREPSAPHSRGALVTGFLTSTKPAGAYVSGLDKDEYSGFNLARLRRHRAVVALKPRRRAARARARHLRPGQPASRFAGSRAGEGAFREAISPAPAVESLFGTLAAARIVDPVYGTRCSTG